MRTGELTEMVLRHYSTSEGNTSSKYIGLTQVRASTGYSDPSTADVMVLGSWPSSDSELQGFEVKISRSDWMNEVKNPSKCQPTKRYCDRWWLVIADKSFVKEGELPDDWGMMAVSGEKLEVVKPAPKLSPEPLTTRFVASLIRSSDKETIPLDVHRDQMKDARRDAEREMKDKYESLLAYVRFLNNGLGINIKFDKEYSLGTYTNSWAALVNNGGHYKADKLLGYIKSQLAGDYDTLRNYLKWASDYAKRAQELADTALGGPDEVDEAA